MAGVALIVGFVRIETVHMVHDVEIAATIEPQAAVHAMQCQAGHASQCQAGGFLIEKADGQRDECGRRGGNRRDKQKGGTRGQRGAVERSVEWKWREGGESLSVCTVQYSTH
jgi:hypothetical protein